MPKLLWVNLETTGMNPFKHTILEVAALVSDLSDPFNAAVACDGAVWFHPDTRGSLDRDVRVMHTQNGLLTACALDPSAHDLFELEDMIVASVQPHDAGIVLAGSDVHLIRSFIEKHMPRLHARLSHQHFDASSIELYCTSRGMPEFARNETYRAMPDIVKTIDRAKECDAWLRKQ